MEKNLLNFGGMAEKIGDGFTTAQKYMTTHKLKQKMLEIKQMDKSSYREINKRLKNIDKIYLQVVEGNDISLKNAYQNIKEQKTLIKNRISSMVVKIGFWEGHQEVTQVIESHIDDIIKNILDIRDRRGINRDWFEGTWYDPVVPMDGQTHYNYDYYTQ